MLDILSILAILPGVVLVILVYKMDRIEKEPISFILRLLWTGIVSTFFAAIIEVLGELFLYNLFGESFITNFLMYFLVVGGAEEGVKYFSFMKFAWNNREFNYKFTKKILSKEPDKAALTLLNKAQASFHHQSEPCILHRFFSDKALHRPV